MEKYDYFEAVTNDVLEYMRANDDWQNKTGDREEIEEYLIARLWNEDSVTGNASGSYTCNAWRAEEYLCHNTDLILDTMIEFCIDAKTMEVWKYGAEYLDVSVRCYLLSQAVSEAIRRWNFEPIVKKDVE